MGFVLGTWQLVYTVAAIPLGFLIDRIGIYRSLAIAATVVATSGVLRSFAVNFETLVLSVALFGIGGCMVSVGIPKAASTWFRGKDRSTATGIYVTGGTVGGIVALSLTNRVVIPLVGGWRTAYLIYGIFSFAVGAFWLIFARHSPGSADPKLVSSPKGNTLRDVREALSKNVILVVIIGITSFLVGHGIQQWLPTILQATNGMTASQAGLAVSMVNVFMVGGSLLAPRLPYIVGSKKKAVSILLFIQGLSVLTISGISGPVLWLVLALRGLSAGFMPLLTLILMDLPEVGPARMGMIGGLYFAVGEIGGFGGPALMGWFKDFTGTFTLGLVVLAIICELMILLAFFLKVDEKQNK